MNKKFFFYFSLVMAILYVSLGVYFIFFDTLPVNKNMKLLFGIAVIAYGIFRSVRSYQLIKGKSDSTLK